MYRDFDVLMFIIVTSNIYLNIIKFIFHLKIPPIIFGVLAPS